MAVTLNANIVDQLLIDADNDGVVDPGDTIQTSVTIVNSGDTDALNVSISDTLNGLSVVPGSVKITPITVDDVFSITGNTPITFTKAQLLGNDLDPDGNAANLNITNVSAGSNGTIVDNGNGISTVVPASGRHLVTPIRTTTYTLKAGGLDAPGVNHRLTVHVRE